MSSQIIRRSSRLAEKQIIEITIKPKKYTKIGYKIRELNFVNNIYSLIELLDNHKVFYKYRNWKIDEFSVYYTIPVNEWFDLTNLSSNYLVNKKDKLKFGKIYYVDKIFYNKNIDNTRKCIEIYASYNF
jgi:hypothetical protein